jgi:MFS family permease
MLMVTMFPRSFLFWVCCRAIMALFASPVTSLADSMISRMALTHKLNYGSMRLWGSLSFALMAATCGMLWERIGLRMMLPVTGLVFFCVVIVSAGLLDEGPPRNTDTPKVGMWHILRQDMGLTVLTMASFLIGASVYLSVTFDGIYMTHLGGTQSMIGFMFGLTAFSELPTMHYNPALIRRFGGPHMLIVASGVMAAAFIGYSLAWEPWMLLVTAAIKGLGFGLFWAVNIRLISERAPEHLASTVQSIVTTATFGVAPVIFSLIGGEMLDAFGPRSIFFTTSACTCGAALILLIALARGIFQREP